jgi:hypothetical protein
MVAVEISQCQCPACQQGVEHPERQLHQQINLLVSRLEEQQRRWYVALEAARLGRGGLQRLAQITGLDEDTIRRGRCELAAGLPDAPIKRVRRAGGGRRPVEKKIPPS